MTNWLTLFRWPNVMLIIIAHLLLRFSFLPAFELTSYLSLTDFFVLSFSIILIAISGNIINDIYDIKTDFVNRRSRPIAQQKIGVSQAYLVYVILIIVAVILAFYLSFKYDIWVLIGIEIIVMVLLFWYAKRLKAVPVLSNFLVSVLVSLAIILVVIVDTNFEVFNLTQAKSWLIFYAVLAFWTNFNRELIKDIIDIKGDHAQHILTLPIILGKSRTNTLIFISTVLLIVSLLFGVKVFLEASPVFIIYIIFGISVPLGFVNYKIWKHETQVNYKLLSHIYKLVLLLGLCSLILFIL